MDKNSAIGLTLIAALLFVYFFWFSPAPQPPAQKPATPEAQAPATADTATTQPAIPDSVLAATYGDLSAAFKGTATETVVENDELKVTFTSKGGTFKEIELKKYKTYTQEPLLLVAPNVSQFALKTLFKGQEIDLHALYYTLEQRKNGDSTEITYAIALGNGARIAHIYNVPAKGYEIGYKLRATGLDQSFGTDPTWAWTNIVRPVEKSLADTRINTTVTYYSKEDGYDELPQRSTDQETEIFSAPTHWVTVKEKFFLSSIIAKNSFPKGEVTTALNQSDSSVVKRANVTLVIPKDQITKGTADFKFYFGPADYKNIGDVAEGFRKNVYLGWPPIYWINKFVIFPVFYFLTRIISNYGVIIIVLVLLLKLVLFPLSYKSYLSMAKMKVLKPELDEIKERVGDDMTKVQQEQMKLYQQVGVNPISGCVPVLLQMPILFAMFYLFPASIELRQEPFLWAEDLSTYDSLIKLPFTLPFGLLGDHISLFTLLMTISTLIYTWQNNQISSVQGPMKSMSYVMPLILLFVLNSFSAGLTFYYLVSNLVTFAQQAIIRRFVDEDKIRAIMEENKKKNASGQGKKSKFMAKLEEAMKSSEEARRRAEEERRKKKK